MQSIQKPKIQIQTDDRTICESYRTYTHMCLVNFRIALIWWYFNLVEWKIGHLVSGKIDTHHQEEI